MAKFVIYADTGGHYRWKLVASNGQTTASSGRASRRSRTLAKRPRVSRRPLRLRRSSRSNGRSVFTALTIRTPRFVVPRQPTSSSPTRRPTMSWKAMADKAKKVFQQRGGATAAKEDAEELRNIAEGQGSVADKAKQAAEAIREPGAHLTPTRPTRRRRKRAMLRPPT